MKRFLIAALVAAGIVSGPAGATDVGVSVSIGQPGFYGRLDIGGFPPPPVIYPQPMVIQPVPVAGPPVYLRVPPGHAKHWSKHCKKYNACATPVYFVQDEWYMNEYAPRYEEKHGHGHSDDKHGGHGKGKGYGHGHD